MFSDAIGAGMETTEAVQRAAAHGVSGAGGSLPHLGAIQRAFGRHDVSGVQAHVGGKAAEGSAAMGARAYATGNQVAFSSSPDLHLAAHEAAHVVQQRAGVQLSGGVGAAGDVYEQHADAVADRVTRGESAEALLDQHAPPGGAGWGIQRAVQRDGEVTATAAQLARALSHIVDFVALQRVQTAVRALMSRPLAADEICPVAIAGAEYAVRATELPALVAAIDSRAASLIELDRGLASPTDVGGAHVTVDDREHPAGAAREHGEAHEEAAPTGHDADGGAMIEFEFPIGTYANVKTKLYFETTVGRLAGAPESESSTSTGGGLHGTPHGAAFGVSERGALRDALAPGLHAFSDSIVVERDHEGVHFTAGVDFAQFHLGALEESHFSLDLLEIESGEHGFRVHGPSVHFVTALPLSAITNMVAPSLAAHLGGARFRLDIQVEPNWRGILEFLSFDLAEEAVAHGAVGAASTALSEEAAMDVMGDVAAEELVGTELVTALAGEEALALLAVAAPPLLIAAAVVGVGVLIYAASEGAPPPPADLLSTDTMAGVDTPLMHLGHAFDRSINEFSAGYAAALRGGRAGASEAADSGHQAGIARVRELVAAGRSRDDIHAMAAQAPDLARRVREANAPGFAAQARQLGAGDARRVAYLVEVAERGFGRIVPLPGHSH